MWGIAGCQKKNKATQQASLQRNNPSATTGHKETTNMINDNKKY